MPKDRAVPAPVATRHWDVRDTEVVKEDDAVCAIAGIEARPAKPKALARISFFHGNLKKLGGNPCKDAGGGRNRLRKA